MQRIDWEHTAVVGVHWQPEVVSPDGVFGPFFADQVARHGVAANAARVAAAARAAGGLVVFTRVAYRPGYPDLITNTPSFAMIAERGAFLEGDPKTRIVDEVGRQPGDVVVTGTRLGGFSGTELDLILRGRGVRTVVFTGVATNLAVAATAYQAVDNGYRIVTVSDACTAATDELHEAYLSTLGQLGEIATTGEIA
ncbi:MULTISPECIES: cysteine hydrolase family protein [Micromonospora]|uniref:cysteine hydrolase family protein n=2 Tax=Micromonosporaceae TaxID=28056 RepID=UPI0003EEA7A2|nr:MULTISPECIES: cysteine hydrolase [Micromonospora]EWM63325.1 isochorismatase [Micromonospora sp. M42]MBC8990852.1 cysteine hydrolase [Micromonospora chalcea]MBP1783837.1 nicotinamidase-related amidase [Micromonospora sp. HB375]MBQ1064309.1 cysteine hydrolase [Micromonospora sp. C41]MCK1806827.1 cysteine hydrolase [Micromonospora sp. R42106]